MSARAKDVNNNNNTAAYTAHAGLDSWLLRMPPIRWNCFVKGVSSLSGDSIEVKINSLAISPLFFPLPFFDENEAPIVLFEGLESKE